MRPRGTVQAGDGWVGNGDTPPPAATLARFGGFTLENGLLRHKDEVVRLPPKETRLLACLVEASGAILPVGLLLDRVWGTEPVGPESLTRCLSMLRTQLARFTAEPVIETFHRRGYRLALPVKHYTLESGGTLNPIWQTSFRQAEELFLQALQLLGRRSRIEFAMAQERLGKSVAIDPNYLPALTAIGDLHIASAMRRYDHPRLAGQRAAAVACDTIKRFPEAGGAKAILGFSLAVIEGKDEGFALLDDAVRLDPEGWLIRFYRGWALGGIGRFDEALADMVAGLRLSPMNPGLIGAYGHVLFCAGRAQDALAVLREAVQVLPLTTTVHAALAEVAGWLSLHDEALAHGRLTETLSEGSSSLSGVFAYALARAGRTDEAHETIERFTSSGDLGPIPSLIAPVYLALGHPNLAKAALARAEEEGCTFRHLARWDPRLSNRPSSGDAGLQVLPCP
ncbi:winged helix-turn-helix domain-containing protein [Paracoccus benzoatiresistens]|uniref:Winged helix-turn-helix domain-containing protein n=1 Tax=Paracoccus benzoatiresistens TaxID=2997341 RepID=A0ABT4J1U7_9RHOB|nr:winged helix-turn-helix domain-containing protein [Paracoccus sp. EF6]MCZ0961098.1 winged helix-turn-helix domain-containing protein [Paracoccus sp. EF6]